MIKELHVCSQMTKIALFKILMNTRINISQQQQQVWKLTFMVAMASEIEYELEIYIKIMIFTIC